MTSGPEIPKNVRAPRDADWPAVLELANSSVEDVPGCGPQDAWMANRRDPGDDVRQHHWVAEGAPGVVTGYVGVEMRAEAPGARLFVVTDPARREDLGAQLLEHALLVARGMGVTGVWMIEYAADSDFTAFLQRHGFVEARRFALDDGGEAVVLSKLLHEGTP